MFKILILALISLASPSFAFQGDEFSLGDSLFRVRSSSFVYIAPNLEVDADILPVTGVGGNLGSASRPFGDLTITRQILTVSTQTYQIQASSVVLSNFSFALVASTGGVVLSTAIPNISTSAAAVGQKILLLGTHVSSVAAFQDQDFFTGAALQLGASSRTLWSGATLELIFRNGQWYEVAYSSN